MARLYDRVLAEGLRGLQEGGWPRFRSAMRDSTVLMIQNVADYYESTKGLSKFLPDGEKWVAVTPEQRWSMDDFPNLAPPLESAWYDFRLTFGSARIEFGVAKASFTVEPGEVVCPADGFPPESNLDPSVGDMRISFPTGGWMVRATVVEKQTTSRPAYAAGQWLYGVHKDGSPWETPGDPTTLEPGSPFSVPWVTDVYRSLYKGQIEDDWAFTKLVTENLTRQALYPTLLADSFMHCKNVESRDVSPPKPLSKKWEKKHGRPQVTYKVLDIDPMKKTLESEGGASESGLKKALHICRGHFAHYPEGLFNRGEPETVWKPQHVRGSTEAGAVVKDYNVKSP